MVQILINVILCTYCGSSWLVILNFTSAFTLCSNMYKLHSFNERSLCQSSSDTSSSAIAVVADDKGC